jgi:hypothetical protein
LSFFNKIDLNCYVNNFLFSVRFFLLLFQIQVITCNKLVSINFRANLDARNSGNTGNGIFGLQISKLFWVSLPPDPPIHARYVGHTRGLRPLPSPSDIVSHRKVPFQPPPPPPPPPQGKPLKRPCGVMDPTLSLRNSPVRKYILFS